MSSTTLLTVAAYAAALVATLVLAAHFTPARWWRRANARALAVLTIGTLGIGSALTWLVLPAAPAVAAPLAKAAPLAADMPVAGREYRTYDHLNLRSSRSVGARRLGVVPAGTLVTATGNRAGDWWEISAPIDGRDVRGWASSLWLRRADESRK
ncbi:SH3 domain-containing protein [Massilia agilis]|uniref:SH3 domain-containing protein n=1 Tax=Massilia agilis TaxID=1811226 RepID=A0ABT2D9C7_9BURK|nr:SH3 domain-containing protein [Massilia agilis]MCS0807915.1 SH3 domain-containing protein [Massilia agilis]